MANTLATYVRDYGDYTFMEKPMNDVDSLVLCQFCYLKFDGLVPLVTEYKKSVSIADLAQHARYDDLFLDKRYEKDNRELFAAMLRSRRYQNLKMNCYINIVEEEWETQFSAITFLLEDSTIYVAYRGTDESIIGWKEDFNMAFRSPVPGQSYAVKYLHMVAKKFFSDFYVGGHSKGGNLAVYAAMNCTEKVQERIIKIYSMDGPGFREDVLEQQKYDAVADRIVKILPQSSLVGMLFETSPRYKVVESKTFGLLQHNPYTWMIEGDDFLYAKGIYESRKRSNATLNRWLMEMDDGERRMFVDTLYQVISASEAENLIDLAADWKKSMNGIIAALKEVDENTVRALKEMVKDLFEIALENLKPKKSAQKRIKESK